MAEKPGFSNFFIHFGPLARPMEGYVYFYHTNFSRRSHPCHPEFCRCAGCRKADLLTLSLGRLWANSGPTLGRPWADFGPIMGRFSAWADSAPKS